MDDDLVKARARELYYEHWWPGKAYWEEATEDDRIEAMDVARQEISEPPC